MYCTILTLYNTILTQYTVYCTIHRTDSTANQNSMTEFQFYCKIAWLLHDHGNSEWRTLNTVSSKAGLTSAIDFQWHVVDGKLHEDESRLGHGLPGLLVHGLRQTVAITTIIFIYLKTYVMKILQSSKVLFTNLMLCSLYSDYTTYVMSIWDKDFWSISYCHLLIKNTNIKEMYTWFPCYQKDEISGLFPNFSHFFRDHVQQCEIGCTDDGSATPWA